VGGAPNRPSVPAAPRGPGRSLAYRRLCAHYRPEVPPRSSGCRGSRRASPRSGTSVVAGLAGRPGGRSCSHCALIRRYDE
jgi:hypothetical protein